MADMRITGNKLAKSFWRGRLLSLLCQSRLIRAIEMTSRGLDFRSVSWNEYWSNIPCRYQRRVAELKETWEAHIDSSFGDATAKQYSQKYLDLISSVREDYARVPNHVDAFVPKLLSFENFVLTRPGVARPFAAGTTSFRNPSFLSFVCKGMRTCDRNDSRYLVLTVGLADDVPHLFFQNRKQRFLKNSDQNLLFFRGIERAERIESFRNMPILAERLTPNWGLRATGPSHMLADRVLSHYISQERREGCLTRESSSLRILDVGSGEGLLTSRIVARLTVSGSLDNRRVDVSLLDIFPGNPKRHFKSQRLLSKTAGIQYICADCSRWLEDNGVSATSRFDLAMVCRVFDNLREFAVACLESPSKESEPAAIRHGAYPHMSDYYYLLSLLLRNQRKTKNDPPNGLCCPTSRLPRSALLTPNGTSVIEALLNTANAVMIYDSVPSVSELTAHLREHAGPETVVHDLSRSLRLSRNHVYWISRLPGNCPVHSAEQIWPQ